ncbi:expressed unknown protein [Seminavis robusta]|uniref:EF-hand domain-containing protein n=1 Tax=Seminavis robusta TaxID=568900 RepID=A0A9N8E5C3_9STRA|nr:expressed unknown protein [Seminavis robusta]|eukprot:Sro634_g179020.1 n/a (454) ;mRNA; f:37265-38776
MYDEDDSENGGNKLRKKVGGGVRKVARNTRRMSLMAAENIQKNTKKVQAAVGVKEGKKKKKKKKKKEKKKKEKRGRSESPRRGNNSSSKPPVTKVLSLFSPKRWRSASPGMGRKKKNRGSDVEDSDMEAPQQTFSPMDPAVGPPDPAMPYTPANGSMMMGMNGADPAAAGYGHGGGHHQTMNAYSNHNHHHHHQADAIGVSVRSMTSEEKYQRSQEQQKIERANLVPFISQLLQTNHFHHYCDIAFHLVDSNKDETVDETELYAGLLLIHLKLGSWLGPAACKPLSRDRCSAMFHKFDTTGSGGLDQDEFRRVMIVLFGNVFARVVVQYTLTILVVPLIAKTVVEFLTWDMQGWWDYWTKPKRLRKMGEEFTLDDFVDWNAASFPSTRRTFFTKMYRVIRIGSDAFWETFPLTFVTVILGLVIAPLVLHYCDDFFQVAVDWKANRNKPTGKKR